MNKRLKDFDITNRTKRPFFKVLPMGFSDDDATKRVVTHAVKRVIHQHKDEFQKLAYK